MTTPESTPGTVTLLFTDIEGSTRLVQKLDERYTDVLGDHHRLVRDAVAGHGGTEASSAGDGLFFTFGSARAGIAAAVAAQRAVGAHPWPADVELRVRMGLHTGEPVGGELGFVGIDVHRAARICDAGHGGQVLISRTTRDLVAGELPAGVSLLDLGEHRLRDIAVPEQLFQVVGEGLASQFPPLRTLNSRPNNLPRQLTSFVGRETELAEAKQIISMASLVTLTGPGGVGKTRLALELASDVLDRFDGGAWFVELGSLTDPSFVLGSVASALGIAEQPGRSLLSATIDHLSMRPALLVFDNCEHVLGAAAETAAALLQACPSVRILATSREPLGIAGESVFPLPSLPLPADDGVTLDEPLERYAAVRLFAERAIAAVPSFRITDQNASAVVGICRQLDGIPLAIELAAARVRALTVQQISERLNDRFRLLTGSVRIGVPRHQTLRATIDWSFDLLDHDERAVFCRLSVFAGGCTLEAAEAVCAGHPVSEVDVLDLISRLVDKSLVISEAPRGEGRYRLLETIRQYARDRLAGSSDATETLRRHRDWYLSLVERAAPEFFRGPASDRWLDVLEREHENLRAALQWSEDEPGESVGGLRLAAALWRFWEIRGYATEGRASLERKLASGLEMKAPPGVRESALTGAGVLASFQGDHEAAIRFHEASVKLHRDAGDATSMPYALNNLANAAMLAGAFDRARELYEECVSLARAAGDSRATAFALINMADVIARSGDLDGARARFDDALQTLRALGDEWGEALALGSYAMVAARAGDHEQATTLLEEALLLSRRIGDQRGVARALSQLADVAAEQSDRDRAMALHRESLAIRRSLGDMAGIATVLERIAWVFIAVDPQTAATLVGAAESIREAIRAPLALTARAEYDERLRELEAVLGETALDAARRRGRGVSVDEAAAMLPL